MNRKILFSVISTICVIALSACGKTTPTPTTIQSNNNATSGASTLACGNGSQSAALTPELTEGPYFKANSPERTSVYENGKAATKLLVTGYVFTTDCKPVADALLDFWQANVQGEYDNSGFTLRGHQFTDAGGHYQLTTVVPGIYPGRTEHIHVKVQAPNGKLITTQLFFPGVTQNNSDGIFDARLVLAIQKSSDGVQGQFNFVVPAP